jgi:hypothetical protein
MPQQASGCECGVIFPASSPDNLVGRLERDEMVSLSSYKNLTFHMIPVKKLL